MTQAKKTHWLRTTLIVLLACGIAGLILAAVQFSANPGRSYVSATIQFSFYGASEGKAPNGYLFDLSGLVSDEVLEQALEDAGLQGSYTAEDVRKNLTVIGIYPKKIAEQMTKYESIFDKDSVSSVSVTDYHATQYRVELNRKLDKKLSTAQLKDLLDKILKAYQAYFARTYAVNLDKTPVIEGLPDFDYVYQAEAIAEETAQISRYAEEMNTLAPQFKLNGKGFGDIAVRCQNLNGDIDRLNANITLNAVSRDKGKLKAQYESEIAGRSHLLQSQKEELKQIDTMMNTYEKQGIIYISTTSTIKKVDNNTETTYDKLVARRRELTDAIADTNAKLALAQQKLQDLTAAETAETEEKGEEDAPAQTAKNEEAQTQNNAAVEKQLEALVAKKNAIKDDFTAMLEGFNAQEINEKTISVSAIKYEAPKLLSGTFIIKAVKTAGPICAIGFMVCMVLLIRSRRREEKA